jgi:peptidoglycan/LPS O-acetylase OafA/YrhL
MLRRDAANERLQKIAPAALWGEASGMELSPAGTQALLPALILCVVLVVPVAGLTYRWIEKPATDAARRGLSVKRGTAFAMTSPAPGSRAGSARRFGRILGLRARSLVISARAAIGFRS